MLWSTMLLHCLHKPSSNSHIRHYRLFPCPKLLFSCEQHAEEQSNQLREQQQLCRAELSAPPVALRQPDHLRQPRSVRHAALPVHAVSAHAAGHAPFFAHTAALPFSNTVFVLLSNLLANPFNCNCHLAWLGDWLRRKRIVTGNPRCQNPYFLKEIPIQDVAVQDFACDDGEADVSAVHKCL